MNKILRPTIGLDPSCVLWMPMNGFMSGSLVQDRSQYHNVGTVYGARFVYPGLSFDGVDDYVDVVYDSSLDITRDLTIEAWIYISSLPSSGNEAVIIATNSNINANRYILSVKSDGTIFFRVEPADGTNQDTISTVSAGNWYHIVGVKDSTSIRIYKNTVAGTPYNSPIARSSANYSVTIGDLPSVAGIDFLFNGLIDEVRIYNRALSALEIYDHYESMRWKFGV